MRVYSVQCTCNVNWKANKHRFKMYFLQCIKHTEFTGFLPVFACDVTTDVGVGVQLLLLLVLASMRDALVDLLQHGVGLSRHLVESRPHVIGAGGGCCGQ